MDTTCLTIISALAVAVTSLAAYVAWLTKLANSIQEARVKSLEEQLSLVQTLWKEIDSPKN